MFTDKMAEKVEPHISLSAVPTAACTAKQSERRKIKLEKAQKEVGQLKR